RPCRRLHATDTFRLLSASGVQGLEFGSPRMPALTAGGVRSRTGKRPVHKDPDASEILDRLVDCLPYPDIQPGSHVTPRDDGIEAEAIAKLLAQLADMALDHALVERRLEDAVDCVEYLRLGDPLAVIADHVFEDAQFAARQGEGTAADLRIAS